MDIVAIQSVVKSPFKSPFTKDSQTLEDKEHLKKRCWQVSWTSWHKTHSVFMEAFQAYILSPVCILLCIVIHIIKEYFRVDWGNNTPLLQLQTWWFVHNCIQVFFEENLSEKFSFALFHKGMSSISCIPLHATYQSHSQYHLEHSSYISFFYDLI